MIEAKNLKIAPFAYTGAFIILLIMAYLSWANIKQAPNAPIIIDAAQLNTAQYRQLKSVVGNKASGSVLDADLQAMRDKIHSLSWVEDVSLVRQWQQGIVVTVLPKQAVAKFGTEQLVDANGHVFVPATPDALSNPRLIRLQGPKNQAPVIMQQLQQVNLWYEPLGLAVTDLILTPRMTWVVKFNDGLRIIVDNENTAQKLLNVSQVLANQLKEQRSDIQSLDLRYKNGFAIIWKNPQFALRQ